MSSQWQNYSRRLGYNNESLRGKLWIRCTQTGEAHRQFSYEVLTQLVPECRFYYICNHYHDLVAAVARPDSPATF
jgi:hypothetical protein